MKYWLFKSEPDAFSIDDLKAAPKGREIWDGIRNYQARNFLRDDTSKGDQVLFYHSSCKVPAIVGLAEITKTQVIDPTQFDKQSKYFDEKATKDNPRWITVEIKFKKKFKQELDREWLKSQKILSEMSLLKKGRLSILPITKKRIRFYYKKWPIKKALLRGPIYFFKLFN